MLERDYVSLLFNLIQSQITYEFLGTIKGVMKNKKDNSLLAICEHGKVNIDGDLGIGPRL